MTDWSGTGSSLQVVINAFNPFTKKPKHQYNCQQGDKHNQDDERILFQGKDLNGNLSKGSTRIGAETNFQADKIWTGTGQKTDNNILKREIVL
jgi:hypothetical protein